MNHRGGLFTLIKRDSPSFVRLNILVVSVSAGSIQDHQSSDTGRGPEGPGPFAPVNMKVGQLKPTCSKWFQPPPLLFLIFLQIPWQQLSKCIQPTLTIIQRSTGLDITPEKYHRIRPITYCQLC